jgi:glycosyltransferase involved in cell wall biosynthesis
VGAPLVTVLINNYNYAAYLADAVESALGQTHPNVEVVVVDDGSTDGSRELLGRWAGSIRTVLKENGGQASALNAGWSAARGDLVLLLDADDVLFPETAARALAARTPGVAAVRYPVEMVGPDREPLGRRFPPDTLLSGDLASLVIAGERCPSPPTSGIALDRERADALFPIPESEWRISADAYVVLIAPLLGLMATMESPGARYRAHGSNRWLLDSALSVDWIRLQLGIDGAREAALSARVGPLRADWLLRDPEHLQFRLASLRLDPAGHPYAGDGRVRLGLLGARAGLATRGYRLRKRLLLAWWFVLGATLPARAATAVIEMGFRARPRPGLSFLTGWLR